MTYMAHVSNAMWRMKNQPSKSTSCSDNALHLLVLVAGRLKWGLQVASSFSIWGCVLKGYFERGIFWRAKSHLRAIEDFHPEHCPNSLKLTNNSNSIHLHIPRPNFQSECASRQHLTLIQHQTRTQYLLQSTLTICLIPLSAINPHPYAS
jgi:hypothetical protein